MTRPSANPTQEKRDEKQYAPKHQPKSSAFQLTRLKQQANRFYCYNPHENVKCHTPKASQHLTRKKIASFELLILGYPTFLCPQCAIAWQKAWNSALDESS